MINISGLRRRALGAAFIATALGVSISLPADAVAGTHELLPGESLDAGQLLVSPHKQYTLRVDAGNLTVFRAGYGERFSSNTAATKATSLELATDGDLELHNASGKTVWSTKTAGQPIERLVIGDNGNAALLRTDGSIAWESSTAVAQDAATAVLPSGAALISADGTASASMEASGNLVVRDSGVVKWQSRTSSVGARAVVTPSLGLAVLSTANRVLWSAKAPMTGAAPAVSIGNDGNLVLKNNTTGVAAWQSVTANAAPPTAATPVSCSSIKGPVAVSETTLASNGIRLHKCLVPTFNRMVADAAKAGYSLKGSGWRDPQRQIELRRQNCGTSYYAVYQKPSSQCSPPTAIPGRSMHERGLAIDFRVGSRSMRSSDGEFRWLRANASKYGIYNLPSENWHWSTNGG